MSNIRKSLVVVPALLFVLACQAISNPIQQVQDTAGTVAAIATQGGQIITQVSGLTTNIPPIETILPNASALPNIPDDIFNPQSQPLPEWNGIPVMPQASAGDESDGMYVYRIAATSEDIQDYYKTKLPDLGWESSFSMPMAGTAIMIYTKGNQVLSITVMPTDGTDLIVMITLE
jgi:hypothetical protein